MSLNARVARLSQDDWCCAALQGVFSENFYRQIVAGLDGLQWAEARQAFYLQREVDLKDSPYYKALFNIRVRQELASAASHFFGVPLGADFDVAAHKMVKGDYIGVHTDENLHGETHRMTVTLNDQWAASEGGVLLALNGGSLSSMRDAWLPTANNGFLFEVSERSFHAVTPIVGDRARYSLIITFKRRVAASLGKMLTWSPFPLRSDLQEAISTAGYMGIRTSTFASKYQFVEFDSVQDLEVFVCGRIKNVPSGWTYSTGKSMNVDQHGQQPKGSDADRTAAVSKLRRIPPVVIVRHIDGNFYLVDGSHRLSHATDRQANVGAVLFDAAQ